MKNRKFENRTKAGEFLKDKIKAEINDLNNTIILAIPRGGVPVAYAVSEGLGIPFHLIITKKLTVPQAPEVAMGAIAPDGSYEINNRIYNYFNPTEKEFEEVKKKSLKKVKKRITKYTNLEEPVIQSKKIIIIDDGIATGYTALVAGKYAKNKGATKVILAVPVCPENNISKVLKVFDKFICVYSSSSARFAVGAYYQDFHQNTDEELFQYMQKAKNNDLLYTNLEKAEI
ncbi:MAG: phosphoribosyltransferase [Promethearchaeota archaeon]|nr:MAG: phosphoribosyltransferase [Candidatus Lokiarchaeota archaeon]